MPLTPPHSAEKPSDPLLEPQGPAPGTWRGALKELRIDTQRSLQALDYGADDDDNMELTPDSMSARVAAHEVVADSAIGMSPPGDGSGGKRVGSMGMGGMGERKLPPVRKSTIDGLDFGSMGRRVSGEA